MIVKVVKVNQRRGFAIIDMKEKDYGWIEIIDSNYLEEEDILEGELDLGEEIIFNQTQKKQIKVFVQDWGCSYKKALETIMR